MTIAENPPFCLARENFEAARFESHPGEHRQKRADLQGAELLNFSPPRRFLRWSRHTCMR
jgi:hypothetical protein